MIYLLLLVDAEGVATTPQLVIRQHREFPGNTGVSVHFRPVRNDLLFESAKVAGQLAYRILAGEGVVRSQLWVEYEVLGVHVNVTGRSSDLLFALALITTKFKRPGGTYPAIAATGVLDSESATIRLENTATVQSVQHTVAKVAAAVRALTNEPDAVVFYPVADAESVAMWQASAEIPAHVHLQPVGCLEDALAYLGITLERIYLGNPFRGLEYFGYEHRSIFFGRDSEVREVIEQLLRRGIAGVPGLLVEGASGSGKSSFLRAGVLPALVNPSAQRAEVEVSLRSRPVRDTVKSAIWRFGLLPISAQELRIAESIRECWNTLPEFGGSLDRECASLADLAKLRRECWPRTQRFVWLIDQFEELFTIGLGDSEIGSFGQFLNVLQADGVWTLASIRADAVPQLKQYPSLRHVFGSNEGQYYLERMSGTALDDVISRPAAVAGLAFGLGPSGQRLDQVLREEAYRDRENALPLLQFTLRELYERRSGRELPFKAYEQLGGLSGSIATTAEAAVQAGDEESKRAAPRIFRSLVSVDDEGRPSRRYAAVVDIVDDSSQRKLLERLVSARLCVTDQHDGIAVVAFAHEALLRTWPTLSEWLTQESALLQARDLLISEARRWEQHGEHRDWLVIASDRLASIRSVVESQVPLPEIAQRFAAQSASRARRATRVRQAVMAGIAALAVIAVVFGLYFQRARNVASHAIAAQFDSKAWDLLRAGNLAPALRYALGSTIIAGSAGDNSPPLLTASLLQAGRTIVLSGHTDQIRLATFSADGRRLVTASEDHTARIWDAMTGRELMQLKHDNKVWQAMFSRDGTRIITASGDNKARIWDSTSGKQVAELQHGEKNSSSVLVAVFSPDASRAATVSSDGTAWIWDVLTGRDLVRLQDGTGLLELIRALQTNIATELQNKPASKAVPTMTGIRTIAFSPNGREVLTASTGGTARVWNADTGQQRLLLKHDDVVFHATFSPDGLRIVTASKDHTARLWDAGNGRELARLGHDAPVSKAVFSPDGSQIVTASDDGTARLWDATDAYEVARAYDQRRQLRDTFLPAEVQRMKSAISRVTMGPNDPLKNRELARLQLDGKVTDAAFSSDGALIVTASDDHTARIWNDATGGELARLQHSAPVESAVFSANGKKVITLLQGNIAQLWDVAGTLGVAFQHGTEIQQAAFSRDGRFVLTASVDHIARVWDRIGGRQVAQFNDREGIRAAVFSADGRQVITVAGDATVWDVAGGYEIARFQHSISDVRQAVFSPDGRRVLTAGGTDYTARIWDVPGRRELLRLTHDGVVNAAIFSPDGTQVLTSSGDHTARIWNVATGKEVLRLGHDQAVRQAVFSRDGRRIVTASDDHTAAIWDAQTGRRIARLQHDDRDGVIVRDAMFSLDGALVVTASSDNTARVWDATDGREIARFRHDNAVLTASFFPDARRVLTASSDHTARVWDVASGRELILLQRAAHMRDAVISPNGTQVLTAADEAARLWDVTPLKVRSPELNVRDCAWLPPDQRHFTNEEIQSDALVRDVFLAGGVGDRSVCEGSTK